MLKRSKKLYYGSLLTTIGIVAAVLVLCIVNYRSVQRERLQAASSHRLINHLTKVLGEFQKLEILADDPDGKPYSEAVEAYLDAAIALQFQVSQMASFKDGSLVNDPHFDSLRNQTDVYLDRYWQLMSERHDAVTEEGSEATVSLLADIAVMSFVSQWVMEEEEALSVQLASSRSLQDITLIASIVLLIILACFHIIYSRVVTKEFSSCDEAILKNRINTDIFEYIEKMTGAGHGYYNFNTKKLVFSSNLSRILGYQTAEASPSFRKILKRVDPADREQVLERLKSLTPTTPPVETVTRIVLPEGEVRNVLSLGFVRNDKQGRTAVFVTKDITSEIASREMLRELNANLTLQNHLFTHMESAAAIGYYTRIVDSDEEMFSGNLYRLLGSTPDAIVPSREVLLSYVLEEDKPLARSWTDPELSVEDWQRATIRIRDADEEIKYFSVSREFFQEDGARILLVTFKDISMEAAVNKDLEHKNLELFRSNAELKSFNHIASHDLQEPIRKIQTLISMLKTIPDLSISEKAGDYLSRISRSANRMQLLILDLLRFSRVSNEAKKFESYSLQAVLESVLEELSTLIEEKGAEIDVSPLPAASIIPSQMQQLFTNLIENALKFGKQGHKSVIRIYTEELTKYERSLFPSVEDDMDLLKISVEDNGIGFDPIHSESIFVIFNRLHDKNDFEGSGIGLAICRKVVENHGGIIFAHGVPGDGSKFTFIIPTDTV